MPGYQLYVILSFPVLLFACTAEHNVRQLPLPFKAAGVDLTDATTRQFEWNGLTLQLRFREWAQRSWSDQRPVLFSVDAEGKTIDSLPVFERRPYYGTDTNYSPWLEISEEGVVTTTDTFLYEGPYSRESKRSGVYSVPLERDTAVRITRHRIDRGGKFSAMQ